MYSQETDLIPFPDFRVLVYVIPVVLISVTLNVPKLLETSIVYEPVNTVDR